MEPDKIPSTYWELTWSLRPWFRPLCWQGSFDLLIKPHSSSFCRKNHPPIGGMTAASSHHPEHPVRMVGNSGLRVKTKKPGER
jgi:hypothetical protein